MDEEQLRADHYCSGKCDGLSEFTTTSALSLKYPNQCNGRVVSCWLYEETQKRKDAKSNFDSVQFGTLMVAGGSDRPVNTDALDQALYTLYHTGNKCKCLCNRLNDSNPNDDRGKMLDSICIDPASVDKDHVVTGVRFKRYDNVIHLELQQAEFNNYRVVSKPEWKISYPCKEKKYIDDISYSKLQESFSIMAEDFVFSEDAVVTGVTLGESLRGRYINANGNFDARRDEFESVSKYINMCEAGYENICLTIERISLRDYSQSDRNPRVSTATKENYERSESCKTRIFFRHTSATENDIQAIVPYIDLQEVITVPPEPIRGVGWYLRGFPGYGGFLALKIFKKV
ncbi:GSCOCG00002513001-RA-CDS [Cotesia congregata]|nr:GSCOCG00002513001-RA-CDS [Cotesia congregata]